jgi:hypothetical protein
MRTSKQAKDEQAMKFARWCIDHGGTVPLLNTKAQARAARVLGLKATRYGWETRRKPEQFRVKLEIAGFDPITGKVVDQEKYAEFMEPLARKDAEKARATKRRRAAQATKQPGPSPAYTAYLQRQHEMKGYAPEVKWKPLDDD